MSLSGVFISVFRGPCRDRGIASRQCVNSEGLGWGTTGRLSRAGAAERRNESHRIKSLGIMSVRDHSNDVTKLREAWDTSRWGSGCFSQSRRSPDCDAPLQ